MSKTFKINGIDYDCEFKLKNSDGQEVEFTKSAIRGMTLVDNMFEPFCDGSISIANPYDFIESEYFFRGDGRDELKIKFTLKEPQGDNVDYDMTYVIIDDGNKVNLETRAENIKTFRLVAKDSVQFTDNYPHGKTFTGKTGKILKDIFKDLLGDDKIDEEEWEDGDFEVSFSPPATYRYSDLIHFLMKYYYVKDGDTYVKSFINYDMKKKKYQMVKISKIFEKNKDNVLEAFGIGDLTSVVQSNPNNPPPDAMVSVYIGPLKNFAYSTPFYNWVNDYFINYLIYGYDRVLGVFECKKLKYEDVKKKWTKKFVDVFSSVSGKPKPFLIKNKTTDDKYKKINLPYSADENSKLMEADMMSNLTFNNLQCCFVNIGSTNRQSGKFIDVYSLRYDEATKPKSDEKILGRWLLTEVHHVFFGDTYSNRLFGVKTYVGPDAKYSEDAE